MKHLGAVMILLTIVIVPAMGYTLKKLSDHSVNIAVNRTNLVNVTDKLDEMHSDVKDLMRAQNIKSSYEAQKTTKR